MLSVLSHYSGDDGDCAVKPERQNSTGNMLKRLGSSKRLSGLPARRADYEDYDDGEKGSRNYKGVYRYGMLAVWLVTSAVFILDRFYWNVWPRQSICTDGCGTDKFCPMDEDPGCLQEGPWSVKVFDAFARISARLIISTTSLMFATMCHGSWNYFSEIEALRPLLYGWRGDNFWLHTVGGWSIGIWVILHVWSLLFPSIFHGFANVKVAGEFGWLPPQVPIPGGNLNAADKEARWGVDDIWRIFWMTVMFGFLMPLSRSAWMLGRNFSLAMVLHTAVGCGFFFDSVRRKTHPHVWMLNTPFVIWYILDKVWCATRGRVDPFAKATRVQLDENYMLLLWRHDDKPKRICDIFWLKKSHAKSGEGKIRACELAHPFTTCSSHDTAVTGTHRISPFHENDMLNARPIIEVPVRTDVSWPGHRFSLNSAVTAGRKAGGGGDPKMLQSATPASGHPFFPPTPGSAFNPTPGTAINASRGMGLAWSEQGGSLLEEEKFRELDEDTMIGAESGCRPGEVAFVIGSVRSCDNNTDQSIVASSVQRFFSEGEGELERHREESNESGSGKDTGASSTTPAASTDESLSEEEGNNNNNNNENDDTISARPPSHPHPRPKLKTALSFTSPMLDANRQSRRYGRANSLDRAARIGPPTGKSTESVGAVRCSVGGGEGDGDGSAKASAGGSKNDSSHPELTGRKKSPELTRGDDSELSSSTDRRTEQEEEAVTTAAAAGLKEKNAESVAAAAAKEKENGQQTAEGTGLTSIGAAKVVPAVSIARIQPGTNGTELLSKPNTNSNNKNNKEVLRIKQGSEGFEDGIGIEEGDGMAKGAGEKKRMGLKRLETPMFQEYRKKEALKEGAGGGRVGRVTGGAWNKMAIVRVHRRKEPAVRECSCLGYTHVLSSFRRPETSSIADIEVGEDGGTLPLRTYGPYRSDYGRLAEFPNLPPLLIIATGAGAALALDFVAYVRANRLRARRPVKVCYSSASLALLQFVTNTLLAESTPGIRIKTALTRHDDLELFDTTADPKDDLAIGRLDVRAIVAEVSDDTEVYFCGGGAINVMLRDACWKRGMPYTGSSVQ